MALTRHYVYDDRMRLCKRVEPETGAALFEYDAGGNVAWTAEGQALTSTSACSNASVPSSERVTRSYDARNRLVLVDYPDATPDVATTYTADGKVATLGRAPTLLSYTYNKRGLLSSERLQFGAINWLSSHSYTTLGHLGATTYPSGHQVAYAPNALGQATQAGTYATGATYHPNGALAEFTYGNGIVHTMSRNLRQLPERSRSALGANVVLDDSYDYDANGNVAAISDGLAGGPGDRDMSYDALDRLAGVVAGPAQGGNGSFAFDPLDNLRVLDQGSRQFRYHYDASNRLAQITSPTGALLHSFGYDARGNTTSKDSGTLTFDRENRLTHSALPTATTYVYDGLGRRVAEASPVSTYFYYSHEGKLLYTNDHKTQANTDHIYLSGSLVAARKVAFGSNPTITVTYQHTDALGSPVAFTDASGNVTRRERMTAWGEPADGTWSNEPGYTGHQMDAGSKLVYMQQRYYDPAVGRFLSVDPVVTNPNSGTSYNRFNYANNGPLKNVDPDGRIVRSAYSRLWEEHSSRRRTDPRQHERYSLKEGSESNKKKRAEIGNVAISYSGSTDWAYSAEKPPFRANSNKCNQFVADVAAEAGADLSIVGSDGRSRPPLAGEIASPGTTIENWRVLAPNERPQHGDIAAYAVPGARTFSGHAGVMVVCESCDGGVGNISAHDEGVYGVPGQFTGDDVVYRRYTGD